MKKNSISEFELEKQEFKIRLKRGPAQGEIAGYAPVRLDEPHQLPYVPSQLPQGNQPAAPAEAPAPAKVDDGSEEICSPMIGTYYKAASPESPAFVEEGMQVEKDTVVCIIEAMKVMNEIKAEKRGTITKILIENAQPVEFGQPLFKIKPS